MSDKYKTLGYFIAELLYLRRMSNHALAVGAGVSDSVIRNLTLHGIDPQAKDPDPRTLRSVAKFLGINPLKLFKLAGYVGNENIYTVRAEYFAYLFDMMAMDKQMALLAVAEALVENIDAKKSLKLMRDSPDSLAGVAKPAEYSPTLRMEANRLLTDGKFPGPAELKVEPKAEVWPGHEFQDMPASRQEVIIALMRAKLALDFDTSMLVTEWKDERGSSD